LIILVLEPEISNPNENEVKQAASNAAIYTVVVVRRVLLPNLVLVAVINKTKVSFSRMILLT